MNISMLTWILCLRSVAFSRQVNQASVVGGVSSLSLLGCSALEATKATSTIHRRLLHLGAVVRLLLHAREHVRLLRGRAESVLLPTKSIVRWRLLLWGSRVKRGLPLVSIAVLAHWLLIAELLLLATCILHAELLLTILVVTLLLLLHGAIEELGLEATSCGLVWLLLRRCWHTKRTLSRLLLLACLHLQITHLLHLGLALLLLRVKVTHDLEGGILGV